MENKRIDADELIRLKKLVDDDIISQEEFELQKKKMLGEVPSTKETERIKETSLVEKAKELTKKLEKNKPVSTLKKTNQEEPKSNIRLYFLISVFLVFVIGSIVIIVANKSSNYEENDMDAWRARVSEIKKNAGVTSEEKQTEDIQTELSSASQTKTQGIVPIANNQLKELVDVEELLVVEDDVEVEEVEVNGRDDDDDDYGTEVQVVDLSADYLSSDKEADSDQIFTVVEQQPEFPGGEAALMNYIKKNLKYPAFAAENGIQGRVTLSFTVEKDGSIANIEVMRSPAEELSSEAIRLVKSMPKWKPGKQRGKAVRVKYVLPVTFRQ